MLWSVVIAVSQDKAAEVCMYALSTDRAPVKCMCTDAAGATMSAGAKLPHRHRGRHTGAAAAAAAPRVLRPGVRQVVPIHCSARAVEAGSSPVSASLAWHTCMHVPAIVRLHMHVHIHMTEGGARSSRAAGSAPHRELAAVAAALVDHPVRHHSRRTRAAALSSSTRPANERNKRKVPGEGVQHSAHVGAGSLH